MIDSWYPHPGPQRDFCSRWEDEVLFGGAAGPGKTDCLIMEATRYVEHPAYRSIIFRRTHPEMLDILDRMHTAYPTMGAEYRAGEHRWYFPSGSKVHLGHMADENSHYQYQGKEYHFVGFDEAGQFLPKQLAYLFSRCRTTVPEIRKRIRYASNPGGPSHQYLKDRFQIGQHPEGYKTFQDKILLVLPNGQRINETIYRIFIPGKVWDNPSLMLNDPGYLAYLSQLPEIERMRLMDGSWDAFEGQKFQELNKEVHGYDGELPAEWEAFGAFDWGYARPWTYGIIRVDYDGRMWLDKLHYAHKQGMKNVGVRQTDVEIARVIREIENEQGVPKIRFRVAGPDIWTPKRKRDQMMGPSPAEEMAREGIVFIKADDSRIQGWQQLHHRLKVDEEGRPWFYARREGMDDFWRTMQALQEDPSNPEDISQKDIEDHIPEMVRYACMTRPIRPKLVTMRDVPGSFQYERKKYIRAKQFANRYGIGITAAYRRI